MTLVADIREFANDLPLSGFRGLLVQLLEDREAQVTDAFRAKHGQDASLDKQTQALLAGLLDAQRRVHDIGR